MLTNHQLRDLTRGLRQSEPSKSPLNVILSAEIHALICGYFASLSMTSSPQGVCLSLVILSRRRRIHTLNKWIFRYAQNDTAHGAPLFKSRAFQKKATPKSRLLVLDCHAVFSKTARNDGRVARQRHAESLSLFAKTKL